MLLRQLAPSPPKKKQRGDIEKEGINQIRKKAKKQKKKDNNDTIWKKFMNEYFQFKF